MDVKHDFKLKNICLSVTLSVMLFEPFARRTVFAHWLLKLCDIRLVLNPGDGPTSICTACDIFTICRSLLNLQFFSTFHFVPHFFLKSTLS